MIERFNKTIKRNAGPLYDWQTGQCKATLVHVSCKLVHFLTLTFPTLNSCASISCVLLDQTLKIKMASKDNNHNRKMAKLERDLKFYKVLIEGKIGEEKLRILREIKSVEEAILVELGQTVEKKGKKMRTWQRLWRPSKEWRKRENHGGISFTATTTSPKCITKIKLEQPRNPGLKHHHKKTLSNT